MPVKKKAADATTKKAAAAPTKKPAPALSNTARDALQKSLDSLEKRYGSGVIIRAGSVPTRGVDVIPSGSVALDWALGVGGYPRGRVIECFGPESCLAEDSYVQYNVRDSETGRIQNHKGGSLRRLFNRFHRIEEEGSGLYQRESSKDSYFTAPCLNEEGRIFHNRVVDVVDSGRKRVFRITTVGGYSVEATAEHKFYTGDKFVALSDLEVGSTVLIHNNTPFRLSEQDEAESRRYRHYLYVKSHGVAGVKVVLDRGRGYRNEYYRLSRSRAVVEADMNGLSLDEYVSRLNDGVLAGLTFLPREVHVHHVDEDCTNDARENLVLISPQEHGRHHATERHNNLRFAPVGMEVLSVEPVGIRQTFDIRMESPFNNYVANNFVVHNSGKTTLALHAIATAQSMGGVAAFIDAEHALDLNYAAKLGVDVDNLLLSQPDYGEQGLEVCDQLVRSGGVSIIVIDSVAALTPKVEIDGEMGDSHVGLQARMMGQALRKLVASTQTTGTILFFLNQLRQKIGVVYGSPEVTTGGNALKFYASIRMDVRRIAGVKSEGEKVANRTRVRVVKNKVAPPFREAEFDIRFGVGIDSIGELVDVGATFDVLGKSGSWYFFGSDRIGQGRDRVMQTLRSDPALRSTVEKALRERMAEVHKMLPDPSPNGEVVTEGD